MLMHTHRLINITADDATRKKASLQKLQTVFGPEFTKLSGGAKVSKERTFFSLHLSRVLKVLVDMQPLYTHTHTAQPCSIPDPSS